MYQTEKGGIGKDSVIVLGEKDAESMTTLQKSMLALGGSPVAKRFVAMGILTN